MTARQTGQRIGELSRQRQAYRSSAKKQKKMSASEKRRLFQLVACGTIFVVLVAVKLLLPGKMTDLRKSISSMMNQNMNVTEVFSAVGRAFSGKENVGDTLGDVYQAVFHPEGEALETAAQVGAEEPILSSLSSFRQFADGQGSCCDWAAADSSGASERTVEQSPQDSGNSLTSASSNLSEGETAQSQTAAEAMNLSSILYSNGNLPDHVSLEQAVLGFDYCTPVFGTLSSDFGYREHPIEGEERFHYGIDIAADTGTEIDCFADGTVTAVGESSSYGKYLIVAHDGDYSTLYAHCSAVTVSSGTKVKEGQKIAEVGQTGLATGPHLHFELHDGETYLDPIYYVSVTKV